MKSILISIKPKWCELIATGKKTIEVRKTCPKIVTPFKCYIYCTKPSKKHQTVYGGMIFNSDELYRHPKQGIKYGDSIELTVCEDYTKDNFLNGKVIGEFVCNEVSINIVGYKDEEPCYWDLLKNGSCLTKNELMEYGEFKILYGWHISDLVIYDKPKKLSEYINCKYPYDCFVCDYWDNKYTICTKPIRPPQSWCYVEERET